MNKQIKNRKNRQKLKKKFAKWGGIKKYIKKIAFFMIGIYGSFMVLEFRSLDLGTRMEMEVWNVGWKFGKLE
jgi:hypothetical protein